MKMAAGKALFGNPGGGLSVSTGTYSTTRLVAAV
jgi:hypothetical protein